MEIFYETLISKLASQDLTLLLAFALFLAVFKISAFLKNRVKCDGQIVIKFTSSDKK